MRAPENPQVFPWSEWRNTSSDPFATPREIRHPGLSMRDYFAGQALAGLMANANIPFAPDYAECEPEQIATASYDIADALLAHREKGQ